LEAKSEQLVRPRRATLSKPTRSPALPLFLNTPLPLAVGDGSPYSHHRSRLQRSNTSPARPNFARGPENETRATFLAPGPHVPMMIEPDDKMTRHRNLEPNPASKQPSELPSKPQPSIRNWSTEESHLTFGSPWSDVEEDIYDATPFSMQLKLDEPTRKVVAPHHVLAPASVSGSTSSSSDYLTSPSTPSISTTCIAPFTSSTLKTVKLQAPPPPKLGSRIATTTSTTNAYPYRNASDAPSFTASPPTSAPKDKTDQDEHSYEEEQRLKTAFNVSIARQISISRQQRQLLVPIRAPSNANRKQRYHQKFSTSALDVSRVASPLGAVASAAAVVENCSLVSDPGARDMTASRSAEAVVGVDERLVAASDKPNMPMLVVVAGGGEEKHWGGQAVGSTVAGDAGEVRSGLVVRSGSASRVVGVHAHQYRNSERVVVERASVVSN
jgi:hypothetical protein